MINIQEVLRDFKRQNNITNDYIAEYCGVTKSTVSRWCNGRIRRISQETLNRLGELLQINMDDLTSIGPYNLERPVLGTVKAGYGLLAEENLEGYVQVSESDYNKGDFFLKVTGDSMEDAHIHDGDLLYVKQTQDVPSGSIAVLLIEHDEVTVKKLIKTSDYWVLQAANTNVEPRIFTLKEVEELPVQVIGRAVYAKTPL